jgi:hypothetical protein
MQSNIMDSLLGCLLSTDIHEAKAYAERPEVMYWMVHGVVSQLVISVIFQLSSIALNLLLIFCLIWLTNTYR